MTTKEIRELARAKKEAWAALLNALSTEQGELLLSGVKDALQYEAARGEHLDDKGNWMLAGSLAGLAAVAAAAGAVFDGLQGWPYGLMVAATMAITISLLGAAVLVLWGIRVRAGWFGPNPDLMIRADVLAGPLEHLHRHLILHYGESVVANSHAAESKATLLEWGQVFLLAAFFLAAVVGLARGFASLPTRHAGAKPGASSTTVPSATATP